MTQSEVKSLLREDFEYIFEKYNFKTEPMEHQYASMLWARYMNYCMFLHAIGTGKTLASLYTVTHMWDCDRVLVISPTSVIKTWLDEISGHTNLCGTVLEGSAADKKAIQKNDFGKFHIINYEGLKAIYGKKEQFKEGRGNKEKLVNKYVPDFQAINTTPYDCLICDECHRLKGWESLQTRIVYELGRHCKKILMLTGTPIAKDIRDFWAELKVLDDGATLGSDQNEFLHTYMNPVEMKINNRSHMEWYPKKGSVDQIVELVGTVAIRYDSSECFELPELIYKKVYVDMTDEQKRLTKSVIEETKVVLDTITVDEIVNKANKLAQISSGFVQVGKDEYEYLKSNPKMEEMINMLHTEIAGKCIIYHNYIGVAHAIEDRLRKAKIKFRAVRGEIVNKRKQIDDFQNDPSIKVLLAHPQSGGEGLNLQMANVIIFFDQIYTGATSREQCIGRVYRKGQEETCVIVDLMSVDKNMDICIDDRIHGVAMDKKQLANYVLDWIRDL